jgi:hypothetical protein
MARRGARHPRRVVAILCVAMNLGSHLAPLLLPALALACNGASGAGKVDGGCPGESPSYADITCHRDSGVWYCPCGSDPLAECPGITNPDTLCDYSGPSCFFCGGLAAGDGTGAYCVCDHSNSAALDAGDSGTWDCVASGMWLCQ